MKPYSVDLREKLLEVREQEKVPIRQIARRFRVAKSWVQKILKQSLETGCVKSQKQGGDYTSKLKDEHLIILKEIIDENNDATQEQLCNLFVNETGIKISKSSMGRYIQKINYTWKKKHFNQKKKIKKKFSYSEENMVTKLEIQMKKI